MFGRTFGGYGRATVVDFCESRSQAVNDLGRNPKLFQFQGGSLIEGWIVGSPNERVVSLNEDSTASLTTSNYRAPLQSTDAPIGVIFE
jgi:hypothetical protein